MKLSEIITALLLSARDVPPRFQVPVKPTRAVSKLLEHYNVLMGEGRALVLVGGVGSGKTFACYVAFVLGMARRLQREADAKLQHKLDFHATAAEIIAAGGVTDSPVEEPMDAVLTSMMLKLTAARVELAHTALKFTAEAWKAKSLSETEAWLRREMESTWYAAPAVYKAQALNDLAVRNDGEWQALMYRRGLLAIDDFGADHDRSGWAAAKWQLALDQRYEQQAPTLITSNLDHAALT